MLRRMRSSGNKENDQLVAACAPPSAAPVDCEQLSAGAGANPRDKVPESRAQRNAAQTTFFPQTLAVLESVDFASFLRGVAAQVRNAASYRIAPLHHSTLRPDRKFLL